MALKALIIARGGSQRVLNKNTRPFAGKNLLQLKIEQLNLLKNEGLIEDVVVNSEDDHILKLAEMSKATTIKRDPYFSQSDMEIREVYAEVARQMDTDFLFANCTSPLVKTKTYKDMIVGWDYVKISHDSFNTITPVNEYLFFEGKPLYDIDNQPRSQDIRGIYKLDWAAAVCNREAVIKQGRILCEKHHFFQINQSESIDIDTETDFITAEVLYGHHSR